MKKIPIFLAFLSIAACSTFEKKIQECAWNEAEKELAWKNAKTQLLQTDAMAEDFYHLSKPAIELRFMDEKEHCTLISPINPRPKGSYLDGGVFVYLDKGSQKVLKIVPIAW